MTAGHHPAGVLMFRYKHGWILINPAIPSRGRHGSALASHHGHLSGGATHGHFEKNAAGHRSNFVVDKRISGETIASEVKAAQQKKYVVASAHATKASRAADSLGQASPHFEAAHKQAAEAQIHAATVAHQQGYPDVLLNAHKSAAQHHLDALTSMHDNTAFSKANLDAVKATNVAKKVPTAQNHAYAEKKHAQALEMAVKSNQSEAFKKFHANKANQHAEAAQKVGQADALAKELEAKHTAEISNAAAYEKASAEASLASTKAHELKTEVAHKAAMNAHIKAAYAAQTAGHTEGVEAHKDIGQMHGDMAHKIYTANNVKEVKKPEPEKDYAEIMAQLQKVKDTSTSSDQWELEQAKLNKLKQEFIAKHDTSYSAYAHANKLPINPQNYFASKLPGGGTPAPAAPLKSTAMTGNKAADAAKLYKASKDENDAAHYAALLKSWKAEYGTNYNPSVYSIGPSAPLSGAAGPNTPAGDMKTLTEKHYPTSAAAGYLIPSTNENANPGSPLKSDHIGGAYDYSGGNYVSINAQLRKYGPTGGSNDGTIAKMDKQFAQTPPLKDNLVLTRRFTNDFGGGTVLPPIPPPMKAGTTFSDPGFVSTSKNPGTWTGNVHMEIQVPAGMKAMDLNHTVGSQHSNEQEMLLPRGTTFAVVSDTGTGDNRKVIVKVVKQGG